MSDHQPAHDADCHGDAAAAPANDGVPDQAVWSDALELDFSRLEMARASLNAAFGDN